MRRVILISFIIFAGCRAKLLTLQDEREANNVLFYLRTNGIDAAKIASSGKFEILVPEEEFTQALRISNKLKLANEPAYKKSTRPSEKEEHFFLERMLAREIQDTLQKLPSVRLARVHIYFPVIESIAVQKRDTQNGSASVLIVTSETQIVDVNQIKNIVAGATGLEQNQILVNISKSEDFVERASDLSKQPNSFNYFRLIWVLFGGCIVIITSTYVFRKRTKL